MLPSDRVSRRHACCVIRADRQGVRQSPGRLAVTDPRRCPRTVTMARGRVIAADRDADRLGGAGTGCVSGPQRSGHGLPRSRGMPRPRLHPPRGRHRRPRNHATCVMACHAGRREARSQQPRGEGSEFNASRRSGPMREDGWLTGSGMATAVDGVPAVERIHAALPAALWARSCLPARGADRCRRSPRSCAGRSLAGAAARGADPLGRRGHPVQVPMTVEPPAGRFTACVVRP